MSEDQDLVETESMTSNYLSCLEKDAAILSTSSAESPVPNDVADGCDFCSTFFHAGVFPAFRMIRSSISSIQDDEIHAQDHKVQCKLLQML